MSVGQDIVGDVFRADMASVGGVTGSGPYTYTEQYPGTLLGTNATATVDSVATVNGVTTLTATISNSSVFNGELTATLVGNDATDFLVNGNFPVLGNSYVYFTNDAAQQPGVDQTTTVAPESADIVYTPVCFTTGTSILTERGPVAVEHLEVGELVVTAWGARRPITWIGRRTIDCRRHPRQAEVMPYPHHRARLRREPAGARALCLAGPFDLRRHNGRDAHPGERARQRLDNCAGRGGKRDLLACGARRPRHHHR